jgi:hypothetical protein
MSGSSQPGAAELLAAWDRWLERLNKEIGPLSEADRSRHFASFMAGANAAAADIRTAVATMLVQEER